MLDTYQLLPQGPLTCSTEVFKFSSKSLSSCSLISDTFEDTAALKIVLLSLGFLLKVQELEIFF